MSERAQSGVRAAALAMLADGNHLNAVSAVFDIPVDTLRQWRAQPAETLGGTSLPVTEQARPWLRFPGTATYTSGSSWTYIAATLVAMLVAIPVFAGPLIFRHPFKLLPVVLFTLLAIAFLVATIQSIRAARTNRFEMRPNAIAQYTLAGCAVLPYADITGLKAVIGKGFYYVQFLTRTGASMTIHPTFSQLEDESLWSWLQAVPKPDGGSIQRLSDG